MAAIERRGKRLAEGPFSYIAQACYIRIGSLKPAFRPRSFEDDVPWMHFIN